MPNLGDTHTAGVAPLLKVLRTLEVWILCALAIAGYAILFLPGFAGVNPGPFRVKFGIWVWVATVIFSSLAVARAIDSALNSYREKHKLIDDRRALRLVPRLEQRWWNLSKQQDGSFTSQIRLDVDAANVTDVPVRLVSARLIRPRHRGEYLDASVSLPMAGSPYHDTKHSIPPHETLTASLHIMVRGSLTEQGELLRVTLGITDQFGDEYKLKQIVLQSHQVKPPKRSLSHRIISGIAAPWRLRKQKRALRSEEQRLSKEWDHDGKFAEVDLILNEEKRAYAAKGRRTGALGTLSTGVQSGPRTQANGVPSLLWEKGSAPAIDSLNLQRIVKLWNGLAGTERHELEEYLMSHLNRASRYAEVSYLSFVALHRMGRTADSLAAARVHLAGDRFFGYSNVLATLSALVSHEHFDIDPAMYPKLQKILDGDLEHDFGLADKINLARLRYVDAKLEDKASLSAIRNTTELDRH